MNFFSLVKRNTIFLFKKKIDIDKDNFRTNIKLEDLFLFYQTDKSEEVHGFSKYYVKHLNKYKNKKINILEIGSATGASASAFAHYFKKSTIFCIDINLTLVKYSSKKIKYFGFDSSNLKKSERFLDLVKKKFFVKKFDFIIDDGSHILSDQLNSLNFFYDKLKKDGIYIIEDFRFPNYFSRCNDVKEDTIDKLIQKIIKKKRIKSNILNNSTINSLINSDIKVYKGNQKISDIVFFKKNN